MGAATVVIFREGLLPLSETFIRSQVNSLAAYRPVYAGCRRVVAGLDLSEHPTVVLGDDALGRAEALFFKMTGWSPRFVSKLGQHHPVLLHAHFGQDGATILPIAKGLGIPLLVTFHGFDANVSDATFRESRSGRRYLRRRDALKRGASGFVAVSKFIAGRLLAQGFPREKIQVHYIGVDTEGFRPAPGVMRDKTVLFVGRLVEKKGLEYLIRAMEALQSEQPDCELVVIGDGPLRESLERQAKSALRRYRFLGSQTPEEIQKWMKSAAMLCAPSIVAESGDAEGLPIVVLESMASGLPVVGFASAGIPEAVTHGESGLLAEEKDWRKLAEYIGCVLGNRELWTRFSQMGRQRVEACFDLRRQTAKLEEVYRGAVAEYGH